MEKLTNSTHGGGGIKSKGFTLIELLAVIVILAVIALIATPIILSILTKVRKSAFQDSAYGIMEAAKASYAESIIEENNPVDQVFSFEDGSTNELSYSGTKPKGGTLTLSKTGEIELAIHNNEWCAIKSKTASNVKLIKYEEDTCVINTESSSEAVITLNGGATIYVEIGGTYQELGAISKVEGQTYTTEIKLENEVVSSIDTSKAGIYTITYRVNEESVTRTVVVLDMKPVIKMSEENETYEKEKEILLNVSGIKPNKVESFIYEVKKDGVSVKKETVNGLTKTLTLNETGNYEVIVTVTDDDNHTNTLTSNYKIDATKPTIEVPENTNVKTTEVTGYDLLTGVTVSDNTGITPTVKTSGSLNTSLGEQTVEYEVTDEAGNIETAIRKFTIVEADGPILNFSSNRTDGWTQAVTIKATATDNSNLGSFTYEVVKDNVSKGVKTITINGKSSEVDISLNETGVYKINLTGSDEYGNNTTLSSGTYNIDVTKPTYTVKSTEVATIKKGDSNVITNYFNNPVWSKSGTGTVMCKNGNTVVTNTSSLDIGSYTITCTATGKTNLATSASKSIKVEETGKTVTEIMEASEDVMALDPGKNLRYVGGSPKNYIIFNNELWKIIGIFNGETKIIRNEIYGVKAWDDGLEDRWKYSKLQEELNGTYLNSIEEASKDYINQSHVWTLGDPDYNLTDWFRAKMYEYERKTTTNNSNYKYHMDWRGAIGLMYPSDYGYATSKTDADCDDVGMKKWDGDNYSTKGKYCARSEYNWLKTDSNEWTITTFHTGYNIMVIDGDPKDAFEGSLGVKSSNQSASVRPALFLKPEVKIVSGTGTETDPYRLSM